MPQNKSHWYDGWFYDLFIAPNQDRMFKQIKEYIEPGSSVIDVGCGTGRFSFYAEDKCSQIVGIDLSEKNINKASAKLRQNSNDKLSFLHKNITEVKSGLKEKYDYAVLTYVIHEVNEDERVNLLNEISEAADEIIIGDYLVPKPRGFWSILNEVVEFAAGSEHYKNYKSFLKNGGIKNLAAITGHKIIFEKTNQPLTSYIAVLSKQ